MKELSRKRVFLFFSIFILLSFALEVVHEGDMVLHYIDDLAMVIIAGISIIYLKVSRNDWELDVRTQNTIITILYGVMLVFVLFAIAMEFSDPEDFGNEIPSLILLIVGIVNNFL